MSKEKAQPLEEIMEEALADGKKTYEAMINSNFLDIAALEKKVCINVPSKSEQAGFKKVTLTIIYDEMQEGVSLKMNSSTKFAPEDVKYINDNYDKILRY